MIGLVVTNVSLAALAHVPFAPAYSISKAAAFSLTQSLRLLLARHGVSVHSVLTGPTDTDMTPRFRHPQGLTAVRGASHLYIAAFGFDEGESRGVLPPRAPR